MTDQILGLLTLYGTPALFGILIFSSVGIPFPATLLLLAVGSFVAQEEMNLWQVLAAASAGAVLGDQLGFLLGRHGGRQLARRITDRLGWDDKIAPAEAFTRRWGGAGIFFSRWLVTPLGPWINLSSGIAGYPWGLFILWDILGEVLWVTLYVTLGRIFSDRVQDLAEALGHLGWIVAGGLAATLLGWILLQRLRASGAG